MKLSEKIQTLRKRNSLSQEDLASLCHVSRQSVSKWEADIALPETDKFILLSNIFHVTIDLLLRDDYILDEIKAKEYALFERKLIKESIDDELILDELQVHKVELWNAGVMPKYWTVIFFTASRLDFPEQVSKVIISDKKRGGNWFVDFRKENKKYIVFRNHILSYEIGNIAEKHSVFEECRKHGITDEEMRWQE